MILINSNIKGRFFFKYIGSKIQPEKIIGRLYCSVVQCSEHAMLRMVEYVKEEVSANKKIFS